MASWLCMGNAALMQDAGVDVSPRQRPRSQRCRRKARPSCSSRVGGQLAGYLGVADPVKSTTPEAIQLLRASGMRIVMLTGDNPITAAAVGKQLGLDDVKADVLPQDKYKHVQALQKEGRIVAMAGDGVNDAPALAQAMSASRWALAPTWR